MDYFKYLNSAATPINKYTKLYLYLVMNKEYDIEQEAIEKYPMPLNACVFTRKRIYWLREEYVKKKTPAEKG